MEGRKTLVTSEQGIYMCTNTSVRYFTCSICLLPECTLSMQTVHYTGLIIVDYVWGRLQRLGALPVDN